MNKPKINPDKVIVTIKKALYDLKDADFSKLTEAERKEFEKGLEQSENLAHSILEKIKNSK